MISDEHREFVDHLVARFDLAPLPSDQQPPTGVLGWLGDVARTHVDVVIAAGVIARGRQIAAALGADGVWTGSVWLTTAEGDSPPEVMERYLEATSSDTVRSRSFTGKAGPHAPHAVD